MFRADSRMLSMWNWINRRVSVARRLDSRMNNLHLFDGANPEERASQPEWRDSPDVQALLMRRDRLLAIQRDINDAQRLMNCENLEPESRVSALEAIARLRDREEREITAITNLLDRLRAAQNESCRNVSKMLADVAKLRQTDAHFRARLDFEKSQELNLTAEEIAVINEHAPKEQDDE